MLLSNAEISPFRKPSKKVSVRRGSQLLSVCCAGKKYEIETIFHLYDTDAENDDRKCRERESK